MADRKQNPPTSPVEAGWEEEPVNPVPGARDSRRALPGLPPTPAPGTPVVPKPAQDQSSLALLAKDLMPPPPPQYTAPEVPVVTDRKVKFPGVWITLKSWARRWNGKLQRLDKKTRRLLFVTVGTVLVVAVLAIVLSRSGKAKEARGAKLAKQGQELLNKNDAKHAAELIESELVGTPQPEDGEAYLVLGHARFAMKRNLEALTAYERALTLSPKLASDTVLRANAAKVLETKDSVAAVVALEILASRVSPRAHDVVVEYASTGKLVDARRRAFAIAEREGIADKIDRVESWSLDLKDAGTCEDRRAIIAKLASTNDKRAVPALKRAKLYKCAERDATEAISAIEGGGSPAGSAK
jgi:hypothetical protein